MEKVYAGDVLRSPLLDDFRQGAIQEAMDPEFDEKRILSPRPRPDLSKMKRRLQEALGWATTNIPCEKPSVPGAPGQQTLAYQATCMEGHSPPTTLFQLVNH